jgi:hypothetical protein
MPWDSKKHPKRLRPLTPAERLNLKRLDVTRRWRVEQREQFRMFRVIKLKGNAPERAKSSG